MERVELGGQRRQLRAPALPAFGQAVQEHHRVSLAGLNPVPDQAVDGGGGGEVGEIGHEGDSDGGGVGKFGGSEEKLPGDRQPPCWTMAWRPLIHAECTIVVSC